MSEIVVKVEIAGLESLIHALESIAGGGNTQVPVQQPVPQQAAQQAVPMQQQQQQQQQQIPAQQQIPVQQMPMPQQPVPMQQQIPVQAPMQVPTTAVVQEFSQDQLAVAAAGLVNQGKQARLMQILASLGTTNLVALPRERYGEFATALRAEGAVI